MTRPILSPKAPIVILTGAGISKESGLETFRCAGGIWSTVRLEDVCTPEGYRRNPALVQDFYNARRQQLTEADIQPNAAHHALARLEREWPGDVLLVTQNIDDLHERAGSTNLIHMHGELRKVHCENCGTVLDWHDDVQTATPCPECHRPALRPHVVWFGEMPLEMDRIYDALDHCGLFVSIGTSGHVYPAAGFVHSVRQHGQAHTVELNLDPSEGASLFAEAIYGPASLVVPDFVEALLSLANK